MTLPYLVLLNTILLTHSLNKGPFDLKITGAILLLMLVQFFLNKLQHKKWISFALNLVFPVLVTLSYYSFFPNLNLKYAFYFLPLLFGQGVIQLHQIKKFSSGTYTMLEFMIPSTTTYIWWNTNIPLALWVIYLFLNGMFFFEKFSLLKQNKDEEMNKKSSGLIWIQNIFALFYNISFIIY